MDPERDTPTSGRFPLGSKAHDLAQLLVWGLVVAWGASSLWYPFGWDQGIFAWVGDAILRGEMPFRDAFDLKGPGAHVIYAATQFVFGRNQWGIRVVDLLALSVSAWLAADFIGQRTSRHIGRWAAAILILWHGSLTFWHTAQPDGFVAALLCIGFLPLLGSRDRVSAGAMIVAGAAIGFSIAIKPLYAAFLVVPAVVVLGRTTGHRARAIGPAIVGLVTTLAVVAAFAAWFGVRGALADLYEVHILYNASTYSASSGGSLAIQQRLQGVVEYVLAGEVFVVLLPLALVGARALYLADRTIALAVCTWAVTAVACVVLQNKFFDYQWAPLFVPTVVLAAFGFDAVLGPAPADTPPTSATVPRQQIGILLGAAVMVHAAVHPAFEVANWASYLLGMRDRASYHDTFGVPGNDLRMAEHIRELSDEDDRLFVMAWNAELIPMTGLRTVSRFGYSLPFWMGDGTDYQRRYRLEAMAALHRDPPEFVVVGAQALPLVGRVPTLSEFPAFDAFLTARYARVTAYGDLELYVLR
jgi:hypothetical protein